ncbi:hypothetical protein SAMN05444354_12639 [Stigmatella aurantiaca]|uniref:Lipoprotein n=1 Tax=Stigmatella aurantiaca TaxID=41 RepID=A0A1H8CGC3_STIAU|nr:hypothetical protein [Stigmatella aurantiaca]SEM93484.1 hypothetical protein SAMN05444354_12639 [Stigmatella aurantiaca]
MKRLLLMAALTMGASACVNGNEAIMILGTTPVGPDCAPLTEASPVSGSLRAGGDSFFTSFNIASSLPARTGTSGERNDFYGEEIIFSYRAETNGEPAEIGGKKVSFEDESLPISFFIAVGSSTNVLVLDLIASDAKATVPNLDPGSTLFVTVKLKGKTSGGGSVESNEATYPIQIVNPNDCDRAPNEGAGACGNNPAQC